MTPAPRHSAIVVGSVGEEQLVEGWHAREVDGRAGIPYRAGNGRAVLVLRRQTDARRLWLLISGPVGLTGSPIEGRAHVEGRRHQLPLAVDAWVLRRYPLEPAGENLLRIELTLPEPPIPDRILGNGDVRALGWYLGAAWQE